MVEDKKRMVRTNNLSQLNNSFQATDSAGVGNGLVEKDSPESFAGTRIMSGRMNVYCAHNLLVGHNVF
jgi:hypothetical protein